MSPTHNTSSKLPGRRRRPFMSLTSFILSLNIFGLITAQCPWPREVTELNGSCLCAFNIESELSIQCSAVNFSLLMTVLHQRAAPVPFDLLYVNNSNINVINDRTFQGLSIRNIQFSSCGIYNISARAFEGLDNTLKNLNLQDNRLTTVPSASIRTLTKLNLLDLSNNKITNIPNDAFKGPSINTLKLADNELTLGDNAFGGLEESLKNINLKGTKLRSIPVSIRKLINLAFLDLAQNQIRSIPRGALRTLHSLTALNLERNLLQRLDPLAFLGVNDTLSSLSLLNNLLTDFPSAALNSLTELRVLDIGFNLMTSLPLDGFRRVPSLTLLALDGNPLTTIPVEAFAHLNNTLRGLSVGGRFLVCDCEIAWIMEWIRDFDLQVTSREREPQFCGQPPELKEMSFYDLNPAKLCGIEEKLVASDLDTSNNTPLGDVVEVPSIRPIPPRPRTIKPSTRYTRFTTSTTEVVTTTATVRPTIRVTSNRPDPLRRRPANRLGSPGIDPQPSSSHNSNIGTGSVGSVGKVEIPSQNTPQQTPPPAPRPQQRLRGNQRSSKGGNGITAARRPPLIRHDPVPRPDIYGPQAQGPFVEEVIVQDAYRKDNSVIIQWDSEVSNILGFRVVYRLFGDKNFKLGPPLAASEREFKIRNVPTQECVVVCVVSLEDVSVTPENVEYEQCREIRTDNSAATHMDTIIIAASAAICGTVIIAVIVFICCNRRRGVRGEKSGMPAVLSPVSAPLASLGTLGALGTSLTGHKPDWDNISMYSQRSIPRARMYHMDKGSVNNGYIPDDARSHISHMSQKTAPHPRSLADGQSQRSYSVMSNRMPPFISPLSLSRPDLRMSRQSLTASQFGGFAPPMKRANLSRAPSQRSDNRRPRSKSRDRASSRLSHAGSTHSLTGYDTDGWTDHDMDIYMARNPTRGGLVQL